MKYPNRIIKQGEGDAVLVAAIQKRLMEVGCGTFATFGTYGPKTASAVKLFQSTHRDQIGNALEIDGKIGPITWDALYGTRVPPLGTVPAGGLTSEAIRVARSQLGVMEEPVGSNRGEKIDEYLQSVACPPGNYWCAGFVYWCFEEAAKSVGVKNPLFRTPGCLAHWNNSTGRKIKAKEAAQNPSLIRPGQIFILDHGSGMGHTGIIESVEGGFLHTIEGNSNQTGSRNGIGVFALTRKINKVNKGFIAY